MTALSPRRTFSGTALKTIACITMLVDHIGASCIEAGILTPGLDAGTLSQDALSAYPLYRLDMVLRFTGRLAFPLFCFLLVEGFVHTHNVKGYLGRLVLFGLLSEVPFDLAFFLCLLSSCIPLTTAVHPLVEHPVLHIIRSKFNSPPCMFHGSRLIAFSCISLGTVIIPSCISVLHAVKNIKCFVKASIVYIVSCGSKMYGSLVVPIHVRGTIGISAFSIISAKSKWSISPEISTKVTVTAILVVILIITIIAITSCTATVLTVG